MAMNLLKKYGLSEDEIPENVGRKQPSPGIYDFTLADVVEKEGSGDKDGTVWLIFQFDLGDEGQISEFFTLQRADGDEDKVLQSLSFLRRRLSFFEQTLESIDLEELIGSTGTLQVVKNGNYVNLGKEFNVDELGSGSEAEDDEDDEDEEPEEAPAPKKKSPKAKASKSANPFG